jgi:hypothetical protein
MTASAWFSRCWMWSMPSTRTVEPAMNFGNGAPSRRPFAAAIGSIAFSTFWSNADRLVHHHDGDRDASVRARRLAAEQVQHRAEERLELDRVLFAGDQHRRTASTSRSIGSTSVFTKLSRSSSVGW